MTTKFVSAITLALATLAAGNAMAADPAAAKTRAQVRAELFEAQRVGDIMDERGRKLNEINPGQYPARAVAQSRSRAAVQAELFEAQRVGDIMDERGRKLNEINPGQQRVFVAPRGDWRSARR